MQEWKRRFVLGVLMIFVAFCSFAGPVVRAGAMTLTTRAPDGAASVAASGLALRQPLAKAPVAQPAGRQHRLTVKFQDALAARLTAPDTLSLAAAALPDGLVKVIDLHRLRFSPVFADVALIDKICSRAAARSRRQQPDLNGVCYVVSDTETDLIAAARALLALDCVESVDIESLDAPPPPPGDISPATPNLESLQTYRATNPGYDANYARTIGALGAGVRFSDCEYGYDPSHEDLVDAGITNRSRAAINPSVYSYNWDEHGTAVLGINCAPHNGYGVSGLAPQASKFFYSEWTTLSYSREGAISDAVADSDAGDVILLEMQTSVSGTELGPAELASTVWNLTRLASDSGIIVVAAAGNGNQDLDNAACAFYRAWGDSGAIIIGAGSASTNHSRLSFSSYGARVNVQTWGESVFTTGYGNYARYGSDDHQSYTSVFNGTSSASACAAGLVCALQSYAVSALGTRLTPAEMRSLLQATGYPQGSSEGGHIGPAVSLRRAIEALPGEILRIKKVASKGTAALDMTLAFTSIPFRSYGVHASTNLVGWSNLPVTLAASSNLTSVTLTNAMQGSRFRAFRVIEK